jgi:acid-sensing ion channel, other
VEDEQGEIFKRCDCLPSCNSITYRVLPHFEKIERPDDNEKMNLHSTISIYFDDDEFIVLRRYASFGTVTLLSNIGGLLGLFLGVSVLSTVEVFYFFVIRLIYDLWRTKSN